jgi:phage terminase large subunit-like protein
MKKPDYVAIAKEYMRGVLDGSVPACSFVKQAVQRQLNDLRRWGPEGGDYYFDEKEASRPCWFIENLTHTKGELAGRAIHLEPWQCFLLTTLFGWKAKAGNRRFRSAYVEVGRGNGKSTLLSGIGLFCLCADHEPGAEVYSFATTREQAKIVFGDAQTMARGNRALQEAYGLEVTAHALYVPATNSTFQAKSAEGSTLDGLNTHLAIIDELHAHKKRDVFDVVETSLGKRRNSLMVSITTAGVDRTGICYEQRTLVTKILSGSLQDESYFGIIYTLDPDDDWKSDEALAKANPNWGVSVRPEVIRALQAKAIATPSAENNFKTKHLDVWCNADVGWMDMKAWDACADESLDESDFDGEPCWLGLDLASTSDMTAKVKIFQRKIDGSSHYYLFGDYWLPRTAIERGVNSQYQGWEYLGYLHVCEGPVTDFAEIRDSILEDCGRYSVQSVAYDPFQAVQLSKELSDDGVPMVLCKQTVANLSDPMKQFQALVLDHRLHFNGDPVLTWMVSNVVCHVDVKENIYPRKDAPENKIDGVVAGIMALSRALLNDEHRAMDLNEFLKL